MGGRRTVRVWASLRPARGRWLLDLVWPGHPSRLVDVPRRLNAAFVEIARLTVASVTAFLMVVSLTGERADLTGALTAMLVVQATTYSTLKMGVVRVGAVLTGVTVSVLLTNWFGLSWWSLGAAVFLSLTIARLLRLGDQMLEAPISAMLILAVHGSDVAVETRVVSTFIGAAVGMAFGLFFAPVVPGHKAAAEVRRVADTVADVLHTAADSMGERAVTRADVDRWLDGTRRAGGQMADASALVTQVGDSRRLNVWAVGTHSGETTLRSGLEVVDGVMRAVAALFTVLARELPDEDAAEDPFDEVIRPAFATVLEIMGEANRAFGRLLEAEFGSGEDDVDDSFADTLDNLRESRAMLTDLMLMDPATGREQWLLRGSVLSSVEQTLRQLDVLERMQRERAERPRPTRRQIHVSGEVARGLRMTGMQTGSRRAGPAHPPASVD